MPYNGNSQGDDKKERGKAKAQCSEYCRAKRGLIRRVGVQKNAGGSEGSSPRNDSKPDSAIGKDSTGRLARYCLSLCIFLQSAFLHCTSARITQASRDAVDSQQYGVG